MDRMWAPWRHKYVKCSDKACDGCVFCLKENENNEERMILQRGKHCFTIMNIYPYNNGHLMVAPYRHTNDFANLSDEERLEIMQMLGFWSEILKEALNCHGFNIGANLGRIAGAGIDEHLHFHIVPRWNGDVNFMPVIGEVKVIPQSLEDCYEMLMKKFQEKTGQNP